MPSANAARIVYCQDRVLDLSHPQVMGILNVTPDSFADGGLFSSLDAALVHAEQMIKEGAAVIDVGGESTRPGAKAVALQEELDRVIPVIERLTSEFDAVISIDTSKPRVMRAAVAAGATMINDVYALRAAGAMQAAAELGVAVCLMHMQGEPRTMQENPCYTDVVTEVRTFLSERLVACAQAGITTSRLIIDPGFGFGKNLQHQLRLFHHLTEFSVLDAPLLVGVSRKSMIGNVLGNSVSSRLAASVALAGIAVWQGAAIIRAHDVAATVDAVRICQAVRMAP
ncbi:MAG: dihydropteroate synthase [Halothiobacillaceae bacterium]|nr:MAG: dihydropteroate synthase [Halothiobacillaceae bacterium]